MITLVIGRNILGVCRWFTAVIATPMKLLIFGLSFFILILWRENLAPPFPSFPMMGILGVARFHAKPQFYTLL
jgi:ATP/ADP translocase